MTKKLVLLLVVFLSLHFLGATTYYVAKAGSDGNDGSKAHPWLTIGKATATLVAGDSAVVDTGTYNETVIEATNGTSGSPIVYHANGAVTVHGDSASGGDYVELDGQYVRWEGFRVYNSSGIADAIIIRGIGCRITNCVLQFNNQVAEGIYVANSLAPSSGVVIDHDSMLGIGGASLNHGVYCAAGGTTITHCYIVGFGACGIQLWYDTDLTNHCLVAWNTILNNHGDGIVVYGDTDVVHDNVFIGNGGDAQIILWYGSRVDSVYNNDCYAGTSDGLYLASAGPSIVLNNIILANATNIYTAAGDSSTVDYNCYWPDGNGMFGWGSNGGNFAAYKTGTGHDAHGICQNPLLADTTAHNFHEQASSPCIDVGDPTTPAGFDFDHIPTPQGAAVDMGAYEYHAYALDVGIQRIIEPADTVDSGAVVTPQAWVQNYGTAAATFPVTMRIGTGYTNTQTATNLAPGDSVEVSFAHWTAAPCGLLAVRCSTGLTGNQNHGNDTLSGIVTVRRTGVRDIGIVGIICPYGTYAPGEVVLPAAIVRNYGTVPADFEAWMLLTNPKDSLFYTESTSVETLAPGNNVTVNAFPACTLAMLGDWTAKCSVAMAGDAKPSNNVVTEGFKTRSVWVEMKPMPPTPTPKAAKDGAWLTYNAASGLIYVAKGNNTSDFYSYNPATGVWKPLRFIPIGMDYKLPRQGACGTTDGNNYVYMAKGNNTLGFWRYNIAGDSWEQLPNIPSPGNHRRIKAGTAMVHVQKGDTGYIYLLKGNTNEFYRYNEQTYMWQYMQSALSYSTPKWVSGSFLVYDGDHTIYASKARYNELWSYNTQKDLWSTQTLKGMPLVGMMGRLRRSLDGGSGAWLGSYLYALKGGNTCEFWRYDPTANTWTEFDTIPSVGSTQRVRRVYAGGNIVSAGPMLFALKGNKTYEFWRYSPGTEMSSQPARDGVMAARVANGEWRMAISPNPVASGFTVLRYSLPHCRTGAVEAKAGLATLSVFDVTGRTVYEQTMAAGRSGTASLDLRKLDAGVYLVRVETAGCSVTQKLVVQR